MSDATDDREDYASRIVCRSLKALEAKSVRHRNVKRCFVSPK